jgi:hypothetical protein
MKARQTSDERQRERSERERGKRERRERRVGMRTHTCAYCVGQREAGVL